MHTRTHPPHKDDRCKNKIAVDGHSKLLLIREETGAPSKQLCQWVDVILLVFNYGDENSFSNVAEFYKRFRDMRDNQDIIVVVVGILPFESECVCVCVHLCLCVCACVCVFMCVCVHLYVFVCVYLYIYVCVYLYVCVHVCVCIYIYTHVCVCVCVCVYGDHV